MQEHNAEQTAVAVENVGGDDKEKEETDFVDKVCDPCGLVPGNLQQAFAHKKRMKVVKAQEEEAAMNAEATNDIPEDEKNAADDDAAVDSMLSNFNIDCCGKAPIAGDEVEVTEYPVELEENRDELLMKNEESASVMTGNNSAHTRSLADIAAKMDDIDLETAAEDTTGDQIPEDDGSSIKKLGDDQVWYKQPLYAGLIILCGSFSIAIFVMAILLIKN